MLARLGKIENIYSIGGTYLQYRWHIFTVSVAHMLQYRWHIFTVSVAHIYSIGGTYLQYRWHIFTVSVAHMLQLSSLQSLACLHFLSKPPHRRVRIQDNSITEAPRASYLSQQQPASTSCMP